jgi:glyoxylase-like metal-dependent hydrolase (beta-lactamase superfamily II)
MTNTSRTIGDFELTVISDGTYHLDGGAFFGVVPKTLWERRLPADGKNRVPTGLNSLIVRTPGHTVLIETGIGNKLSDKMVQIYGQPAQLLDNLSAAGFSPEDFDIVINTHLHFDHCGWNTIRRGGQIMPAFPKAKYYVQEGEWQYAQNASERDRISYISDNYNPLVASGQMELLQGDREIVPGISVKVFPGHTAHMQAVTIASGGRTACYISDLIPTTAHLDMAWSPAFDLYPLDTIASRKRYYAQAIPEEWLTVFTHDVKIPWGYVEKDEKGKYLAHPDLTSPTRAPHP